MNVSSLDPGRRNVLITGVALAGAAAIHVADDAGQPERGETRTSSSTITTKDGTRIHYKCWGSGQPIVFHHGWPLSADDWDAQMLFFLSQGYRVIAHDRRGHSRSSPTETGNDMDTYAADVAEPAMHLDLRDVMHVGHSTGGGEVVRYVARYGNGRVAKAVLIGAVPPIVLKTESNPGGLPMDASLRTYPGAAFGSDELGVLAVGCEVLAEPAHQRIYRTVVDLIVMQSR